MELPLSHSTNFYVFPLLTFIPLCYCEHDAALLTAIILIQ